MRFHISLILLTVTLSTLFSTGMVIVSVTNRSSFPTMWQRALYDTCYCELYSTNSKSSGSMDYSNCIEKWTIGNCLSRKSPIVVVESVIFFWVLCTYCTSCIVAHFTVVDRTFLSFLEFFLWKEVLLLCLSSLFTCFLYPWILPLEGIIFHVGFVENGDVQWNSQSYFQTLPPFILKAVSDFPLNFLSFIPF